MDTVLHGSADTDPEIAPGDEPARMPFIDSHWIAHSAAGGAKLQHRGTVNKRQRQHRFAVGSPAQRHAVPFHRPPVPQQTRMVNWNLSHIVATAAQHDSLDIHPETTTIFPPR